jgi:uncharacterized protein (TIGR02147 family)
MARTITPDVTAYTCYRRLLDDHFQAKRARRPGLTHRRFAGLAGFKSPNYLQLVINGQRNLSPEAAPRVGQALGLSPAEVGYFVALVFSSGARTEHERQSADKSLHAARRELTTKRLVAAQRDVLGKWHHLVIRELASLPDFEESGAWISARLGGRVDAPMAEESLALLVRAGLLSRSSSGRLAATDPVVDTGDDYCKDASPGHERTILELHLQVLTLWGALIKTLAPSERDLSFLNLPLDAARLPELKERIRAFEDDIIGWAQQHTHPTEVYQLGFSLFPLTRSAPKSPP